MRHTVPTLCALVLTASLATAPAVQAAPKKLKIGNATVTETDANKAAKFEVKLSAATNKTVKVDFKTVAGTASAGDDFIAKTGTVRFRPGTVKKTISVPVVGDLAYESQETFKVRLKNPVRASLADAIGRATITDDDAAVVTLYDINTGVIPDGTSVLVEDVMVTAVRIHPQQGALWTTELGTNGGGTAPYSSIEVFLGAGAIFPTVGDTISLEGTVGSPGIVGSYSLLANATTTPVPLLVTANDLTAGDQYESHLVTFQNVTVASVNNDTLDVLTLNNEVVVDDTIFNYDDSSYPVGTEFSSLIGVVDTTGATPKILPRSLADMNVAP